MTEDAKREEPWIQSVMGAVIEPFNLQEEMVDIQTIAAHGARLNRFGGATGYPVAQHSVYTSLAASRHSRHLERAMLVHDAEECLGLVDIPSPVLRHDSHRHLIPLRQGVRDDVMAALGVMVLKTSALESAMKALDLLACRHERDALMRPPPKSWGSAVENQAPQDSFPLLRGLDIIPLDPAEVEFMFVLRAIELDLFFSVDPLGLSCWTEDGKPTFRDVLNPLLHETESVREFWGKAAVLARERRAARRGRRAAQVAIGGTTSPDRSNPPRIETESASSRPDYYAPTTGEAASDPYEPWKVIDAWGLDFYKGNAVKYIARAGRKTKDERSDLEKARAYIDAALARLG